MRSTIPTSALVQAGVGVRVNVARGGRVLAVDVPVENVKVSYTDDRVVPTEVTFDAPLDWVPEDSLDPLDNFGQRIQLISQIETDGQVQDVEFGWFLITEWDEGEKAVSVTALDLMQVLEENEMDWPSSPPSGATLRSELQRLATLGHGASLPIVLDCDNFLIDSTIQWDTSRTKSIQDLCTSYALDYGVHPDGCLHVWEKRDGRNPVAHYTGRDLLLSAYRTSQDRKPNRFVVVGSSGSGDDATNYIAVTETSSAPYDPAGYGVVTQRTSLSGATTQAVVTAAAQQALRDSLSTSKTRSLAVVMDPRIEGGDVVSCITDKGEVLTGRVTAYSMTLDQPDEEMRIDVEVLAW